MSASTLCVGIDGTSLIGRRTGVGNYTYDLIAGLADHDPDIRLRVMPISWRTSREVELPPRPNVELVRRLAPARPLRALWDRTSFPPLEAMLRCDVFHATNFVAPRTWRTPTVVTVHDLWFLANEDRVAPTEAALAAQLPGVLRRAAAVVAVSEFVRGELLEWLPELASKTTAIPIAPHTRAQGIAPPLGFSETEFLLVLGTVNARKNVALAVETLALMRQEGLGLPLVVAGGIGQQERRDLESQMRRLSLTDADVQFLGFVDDAVVNYLLSKALVLVSPSLHEGFGLPLVEAMTAGLPIVAVDGGAVAEVVGPAGLLVPPDASAMSAATQRLLVDSQLRQSFIKQGHDRAAEYSWSRTARETLALYRQLT